MELIERKAVGAGVVEVHGKLIGSAENCEAFHEVFKGLLNTGIDNIIIDLTHSPWANSQGIGMLIGAHTSIINTGGKLVLSGVSERIKDVLAVTKLDRVFKTFDSEDGAVKYLTGKDPGSGDDRTGAQPPSGP